MMKTFYLKKLHINTVLSEQSLALSEVEGETRGGICCHFSIEQQKSRTKFARLF